MASFQRQCRMCAGEGGAGHCPGCSGLGHVKSPITIPVMVRPDSRAFPIEFVMIVSPDGTLAFRKKGCRTTVCTSVQSAFNRAQGEAAAAVIKERRAKKKTRLVSRGLLRSSK